ncbi:MAG: hypothetical protein K940chlam3_00067 [Chlamydiae bacterium]|nr:hypothetical protein [Chlamydiota bacterium]
MITTTTVNPTIVIENLAQENESFHNDLKEIFEINTQVGWGRFNRGSMTRRAYSDPCPYLVAKVGEAVAGYIISEKNYEGQAYIPFIATNPDFQGQGIGKKLMLAAIENARKDGRTGVVFKYRGNKDHLKKFYTETIPTLAKCTFTTEDHGKFMNGDPKVGVNYEI